jgi:hypothetical protein
MNHFCLLFFVFFTKFFVKLNKFAKRAAFLAYLQQWNNEQKGEKRKRIWEKQASALFELLLLLLNKLSLGDIKPNKNSLQHL